MKEEQTVKTHKFFIAGKVYDTAVMSETDMETDVQNYLDNSIEKKGAVSFGLHIEDDRVTMVFIRFIDYDDADLKNKLIMDTDCYLTTGENYNGFKMPRPFPKPPIKCSFSIEQAEFKKAYKESALLLGADEIKRMKLEVTTHSVVFRLSL